MQNTFKPNFLDGKVCMITGSTGILFGIAKNLLQFGCQVIIMSRKQKNVDQSVQELKKYSDKILGLQCDVRNIKNIEDNFDLVLKKFNKIDILINGAAGNFLANLGYNHQFKDNLTFNGFRTVMEIDAFGTFNCSKIFYQKCKENKGLNIVNISATLHYNGTLMQTHSGAAKAAVDAMTKHLAVELGPQGIRVNGIAPGPIEGTEGFKKLRDPSAKDQELTSIIPMQRAGTTDDIGAMVLFLISDSATYITGQTIVVDGGQALTMPNFPFTSEIVRNAYKSKL